MERFTFLTAALAAAALLALGVVACSDDDEEGGDVGGVTALENESCAEIEYGGGGDADVIIASDLPMQGDSQERSEQQVAAIKQVLEDNEWSAGGTNVAFQACDDSLADTGEWDEKLCRDNAKAYSGNSDVVGVIGTYNSGCAAEMIPILNEASGGGLAMVSPGNTLVCLTEESATCPSDQPKSLYPTERRNYARVVPNDAAQGAGLAQFASDQGIERPFILFAADDETSRGQAETFRGAAIELGMDLAGFDVWDPDAPNYTALMKRVAEADPDAVLLAGLLEQNGPKLIADKVAELGPNDGDVKLLAPDGFAQQATIDDAPAAQGMYVSVPGQTPDSLTGPGAQLVDQLGDDLDAEVELFAPYAGQAAQVMLDAIASDASRSGVIEGVFATSVSDGIIGSFEITPSGDPSESTISTLIAADTFELQKEITPEQSLIDAALGG